ncbi:ATP-dependent Clp protease ATP-binding subunit ClpA, partial [Escherichia coli]
GKRKEAVKVADSESGVAGIAHIPEDSVAKSERDTLENIGGRMKVLVFGQGEAVEARSDASEMERAGLGHERKPVGWFLLAGTT